MKDLDIKLILQKYRDGTCSEKELAMLNSWYLVQAKKQNQLSYPEIEESTQAAWVVLEKHIGLTNKKDSIRLWPRLMLTASIITVIAIGIYFYNGNKKDTLNKSVTYSHKILPGGNTARLLLANGKIINLNHAKSGVILKDSLLVYNDGTNILSMTAWNNTSEIQYNQVVTPRGGTYQITLADGTRVWLNASSSLKFPTNFKSAATRRVQLVGEAYFEVKKDNAQPFVVVTDKQEVKVLGTHFNINSYADERTTKTTLLEGVISVSALTSGKVIERTTKILRPNQQAVLKGDVIAVKEIDAAESILWTNGKFSFNSEEIQSVMNQVSRWYNVEIVYAADVKSVKVSGSVSRFANISSLLDKLQKTGLVSFKIEGNKIIVSD